MPSAPEYGSSDAVVWEPGVKEFVIGCYRAALAPRENVMNAWRSAQNKPLSEAAKVALEEPGVSDAVSPENMFWSLSDTGTARTDKQRAYLQSLLRSKKVPDKMLRDISELVQAQKTSITKKQAQSIISALIPLPSRK